MANAVKNAILRKKISNTLTDLMVKTKAEMVYTSETETLVQHLAAMKANIAENAKNLADLMGEGEDGETKSIADQISEAIDSAIDQITNSGKTGSIDVQITAINNTLNAIQDGTSGILKTAQNYVDGKLGYGAEDNFTSVKDTINSLETSLKASIAAAFKFMDSVDYLSDIDAWYTSHSTVTKNNGDVFQVKYGKATKPSGDGEQTTPFEANSEFAWNGTTWVELGSLVDLSSYATITYVDGKFADANTKAENAASAAQTNARGYTDDRLGEEIDAKTTVAEYIDEKLGNIEGADVKADITAAETAAKTFTTQELAKKGRVVTTSEADGDEEPEGLAENDLWIFILNDSTTPAPKEEEEEEEEDGDEEEKS